MQESNAQAFDIDSKKKQVIVGAHGSRLTIPPGSFDTTSHNLTVRMIEVTNSYKAATLGPSFIYKDGMLESAGMVHLEVVDQGRPVQLKPGSSLQLSMPDRQPGRTFNVYRRESDQWVQTAVTRTTPQLNEIYGQVYFGGYSGSSKVRIFFKEKVIGQADQRGNYRVRIPAGKQVLTFRHSRPRIGTLRVTFPVETPRQFHYNVSLPSEGVLNNVTAAVKNQGSQRSGDRGTRFADIYGLGWVNFDYPHFQMTCIKAKFIGHANPARVTVFAVDKIGSHTVDASIQGFKTRFFANARVRVLVRQDQKMGLSPIFTTAPSLNGRCQILKPIHLKTIAPKLYKSPALMLRYLGIKG